MSMALGGEQGLLISRINLGLDCLDYRFGIYTGAKQEEDWITYFKTFVQVKGLMQEYFSKYGTVYAPFNNPELKKPFYWLFDSEGNLLEPKFRGQFFKIRKTSLAWSKFQEYTDSSEKEEEVQPKPTDLVLGSNWGDLSVLAQKLGFYIDRAVHRIPMCENLLENQVYYPEGILVFDQKSIAIWSFANEQEVFSFLSQYTTR